MLSLATRLGTDAELRAELQQMARDLHAAWERLQAKRATRAERHGLRKTALLAGIGGGVALALRKRRTSIPTVGEGATPRLIESSIEVAVPVSTAYNQWTQFEEFPQFMQGVEEVRQLDDTRLHWVRQVGGRRAEWDAKILEQHPDRQIGWMSEDGKKTRGTVTFESLGENLTRVRLSLGYQAEGFVEAVGSAAGFDRRRVDGDLSRFKELIESRGTESGAWREDISAGTSGPAPRAALLALEPAHLAARLGARGGRLSELFGDAAVVDDERCDDVAFAAVLVVVQLDDLDALAVRHRDPLAVADRHALVLDDPDLAAGHVDQAEPSHGRLLRRPRDPVGPSSATGTARPPTVEPWKRRR